MNNRTLPIILLLMLLSIVSRTQTIESIQTALDSIKFEKSLLLEKLEEYEVLENEYSDLISKIMIRSDIGKYYKVTCNTLLYEKPSFSGRTQILNKGNIVKLENNEKRKYFVNFNGTKGYVLSMDIKEIENYEIEKSVIPDHSVTSKGLLPHSNGEIVRHTYYTLSYSEQHEQAEWVFYKLTDQMLQGSTSRTDNFRPDGNVSSHSASIVDYKGSGYDRGHLCPAGDMTTNMVAMSESFFMSNMSPQAPSFNRGIWKSLEATVRNWASIEREIYVVTGGMFDSNLGSIGSNGVTIPGEYYKVIYDPTDVKKMIAFVLPNKKGEKGIEEYAVTVDYVESRTGIDFFSGLQDDIEDKLESEIDIEQWEFKQLISNNQSKGTAEQCKGKAKSTGKQCRNKTTNENGYCHVHQSQCSDRAKLTIKGSSSVQCKGKTQKGTRCKNKTLNTNGYCHHHQPKTKSKPKSTYSRSSYKGSKTIRTGPRGGRYYINSNGNKTYIKK